MAGHIPPKMLTVKFLEPWNMTYDKRDFADVLKGMDFKIGG
jgi:hypothetical protein